MIEPLELHIGRKRAAPSVCPQCGRTPYKAKKNSGLTDASVLEMLKHFYASPTTSVVKREVPGWKGYYTWWFICSHGNPLEALMSERLFLRRIDREKNSYGFIPIPLKIE